MKRVVFVSNVLAVILAIALAIAIAAIGTSIILHSVAGIEMLWLNDTGAVLSVAAIALLIAGVTGIFVRIRENFIKELKG